jgi:CDGSH-type Zn-finger protein
MNTILVTANGPLECRGEIEIVTAAGTVVAKETETWLCRCGQSANKPYCDGSHKTTGFRDTGAPAPAAQPTDTGRPEGVLRVTLRLNGPLRLDGRFEVRTPAAGLIFSGSETALCRCGQSAKKPFCDGTHRQVGFAA